MSSKRSNIFSYNNAGARQPKAGTRVPGGRPSSRYIQHQYNPTAVNVGNGVYRDSIINTEIVFTRNHQEKTIKRELFVLEGEEKFEKLTVRNKMTLVVKRGDDAFQDWFYSMGAEDKLPRSWEEFKIEVIRYCTGTGLVNQQKFFEEKWFQFVERIFEWAILKGYQEKDVIDFLRKFDTPLNIRTLIFTAGYDVKLMVNLLRDWECQGLTREKIFNNKQGKYNDKIKVIKC